MINRIVGTDGTDTLVGGDGDDFIEGLAGKDKLDGGEGFDIASYATANVALSADLRGNQIVRYLQNGRWKTGEKIKNFEGIVAGEYDDILTGNDRANVLMGGGGSDTLRGNGGNDLLQGGVGRDVLDGGDGFDIASFKNEGFAVSVDLRGKQSVRYYDGSTWRTGDKITNFEGVIGSDDGDNLVGNDDINVLSGGDGDDAIYGMGGDDTIKGGAGDDLLDGGAGFDIVSFEKEEDAVRVDLRGRQIMEYDDDGDWEEGDSITGFEGVTGSSHDDRLIGNAGANVLRGNAGIDWIMGREGDDFIEGGYGIDFLDGGGGFDVTSYENTAHAVEVDLRGDQAMNGYVDGEWYSGDALWNFEGVVGSQFADVLNGNDADNVLRGKAGDDTISGYAGDDLIEGGEGRDSLDGGAGIDIASYENSLHAVSVDLRGTQSSKSYINGRWKKEDALKNFEGAIGTANGDNLVGNDGTNVLKGGGSADAIYGMDGDDVIVGGEGSDNLDGGAGFDITSYADESHAVDVDLRDKQSVRHFEKGRWKSGDKIKNFEGAFGTSHDDRLTGDDQINLLHGNAGDDVISGHGGNDMIDGGDGIDVLDGGEGFDIASYENDSSAVKVDLRGDQSMRFYSDGRWRSGDKIENFEAVMGTSYNDELTGNNFSNVLTGNAGADTISGNGGDDVIEGGTGLDILDGGDGVDVVSFKSEASAVTVDLRNDQSVHILGEERWENGDSIKNFEGVHGSGFSDRLIGDGGANVLRGHAGNGGADVIEGGAGLDVLDGGAGFDVADYQNEAHSVAVDLRDGQSMQFFENGRWKSGDNIKNFEGVYGSAFNDVLSGDDADNVFKGGAGSDTIDAKAGDDFLIGNNGNDKLSGGDGNDWLYGGAGEDVLVGGDGDDYLDGGRSIDKYNGGAGLDTVSYMNSFGDEGGSIEADLTRDKVKILNAKGGNQGIEKIVSIENIIGSGGDDKIRGDSDANVLIGGLGHDYISGGGGNDKILGGFGNNYLKGDAGDDQIFTNAGNSVIDGGSGDDTITIAGKIGDNTVNGGSGDDVFIFSNIGSDNVNGGSGTDRAVWTGSQFEYTRENNSDGTITFSHDEYGSKTFANVESFSFSGGTTTTLDVKKGVAKADFSVLGEALADDTFVVIYNVPSDVKVLGRDVVRGGQSSNGTYSYTIPASEAADVEFSARGYRALENIGAMPALDVGDLSAKPSLRKKIITEVVITKASGDEDPSDGTGPEEYTVFGEEFSTYAGDSIRAHAVLGTSRVDVAAVAEVIEEAEGYVEIGPDGFAIGGEANGGVAVGAVAVANIGGFATITSEVKASAEASASGHFKVSSYGIESAAALSAGVSASFNIALETDYIDVALKNVAGANASADAAFRVTLGGVNIQAGADAYAGLERSVELKHDEGPVHVELEATGIVSADAGADYVTDVEFNEDQIGGTHGYAAWAGYGYTGRLRGEVSDGYGIFKAGGAIEGYAGVGVGATFSVTAKIEEGKLTVGFALAGELLFGYGASGELTIDFGAINDLTDGLLAETLTDFVEGEVINFFRKDAVNFLEDEAADFFTDDIASLFEEDVFDFFNEDVADAVTEDIPDFFEGLGDDIVDFFEDLGDDIEDFFENIGDDIVDFFEDIFG